MYISSFIGGPLDWFSFETFTSLSEGKRVLEPKFRSFRLSSSSLIMKDTFELDLCFSLTIFSSFEDFKIPSFNELLRGLLRSFSEDEEDSSGKPLCENSLT